MRTSQLGGIIPSFSSFCSLIKYISRVFVESTLALQLKQQHRFTSRKIVKIHLTIPECRHCRVVLSPFFHHATEAPNRSFTQRFDD